MNRNLAFALLALPSVVMAADVQPPRIAVTDLAYEQKVARYFNVVSYKGKGDWDNSSHSSSTGNAAGGTASNSSSNSSNSKGSRDEELLAASGEMIHIDRGELRRFTADIKGAMLKSGVYRLVQATPYLEKEPRVDEKDKSKVEKLLPAAAPHADEKLFDIIGRIRKGQFPNADYVLFTTITSVEPRQELNPIQGSNGTSYSLSVELMIDCSLIDTKTYEVKAAFSALGEGQDMRIMNAPGQVAHLSTVRVLRDVSKSLGEDVASQLEAQFDPSLGGGRSGRSRDRARDDGRSRQSLSDANRKPDKVIEYR